MGAPGATGATLLNRLDAVQWPLGFDQFHTSGTAPLQISYAFEVGRPSDLGAGAWTDVSGWGSYTGAERAAVRRALGQFEDVLNVRFVETAVENTVDITFLRASEGVSGGRGQFSFFTGPFEYDGFVLFNTNRDISRARDMDLILHEIGHALSLKHPGNYDVNPANAPPGPYLPQAEDNDRYTLMSYFQSDELQVEARSLMLYDIAALQERWGANQSHNAGSQTHAFDASDEMRVIWDTGGTDWLSAAGVGSGAVVDLREGHFSSAGGFDRVAVAYDTQIENARGGSGADLITGNALANRLMGLEGNDTLAGGAGADYLDGGAGADRMEGGSGNDFYIVGTAGDQVIETLVYSQGGGIDTVRAYVNYTQPMNIELVRLSGITGTVNLSAVGNDAPGTLVGNAGDNGLNGRGGNDQINGNAGNDRLIGGVGRDTLVGGSGADVFIYGSVSESRAGGANRDVINGLTRGADRIDLRAIDADTTSFGLNDAFEFIGFAGFSGAGQLRLQNLGGANAVLVEGDHNGDGVADFQIFVNLTTTLGAGDFLL